MSENNINTNIENENEEIKTPVFSSKFIMHKELFYDFCSVSYNRIKKLFLIFFCVFACQTGANLFAANYAIIISFGLFISFLMLVIYLTTKKSIKINYERNLIAAGKESTLNYEFFEDKIVSHIDESKREYFYQQITGFFETKNFILLHLKHNLYISIEKSSLTVSVDEAKAFLEKKCLLVKKNKFINCSNDKKWCLRFLIALIAVCIIGTAAGKSLSIAYSKPIHFRHLDFSTTRSDVENYYGEPDETREFVYPNGKFYEVYEAEYLGVEGELEFTYLENSEELYVAQFIVYSNDFASYEDYEKAVDKTYKYFNMVLSGYQKYSTNVKDNINTYWSRDEDDYIYSMYESQKITDGLTDYSGDCTIFQFNKFIINQE